MLDSTAPNRGTAALLEGTPYSSPIRSAAINASCGMLTLLPAYAGTSRPTGAPASSE